MAVGTVGIYVRAFQWKPGRQVIKPRRTRGGMDRQWVQQDGQRTQHKNHGSSQQTGSNLCQWTSVIHALPDLHFVKCCAVMTLAAVAPEVAVVDVVLTVTGDTGRGQAYLASGRSLVAGKAVNAFMAAIELEFGAGVMVEFPQ